MAVAAKTVDWATAIATALAALGTLAAVVVAMFGSDIRARRRRPVIAPEPEEIVCEIPLNGVSQPQVLEETLRAETWRTSRYG